MRFTLLAGLLIVACKSNSKATPDAAKPLIDAAVPVDVGIDAAPTPAGCDYGEQNDQGNDDSQGVGVAEATGLAFTSTTTTLCGNVNMGHFAQGLVDADSYAFAVSADTDVLVSFTGALGALDHVEIDMLGTDGQGSFVNAGVFLGDHGILNGHVPAGNYELAFFVQNSVDITAVIPYKISIVTDTPATRCPTVAAAADYTEQLDTVGNDQAGNDVVTQTFENDPSQALTASTTDAPEPTGLTLVPATNYRLTGTATLPTAASPDDYLERDTYLVKTGATTNQLAIRLNWPGVTEDFDFFVFTEVLNTTDTPVQIAGGSTIQLGEDEFQTFAVLPNTDYWIWVAPFNTDATSGPALPITYDVSICGEQFTP